MIFYGGNLISWSSRKQKVVARSSTEVEYRAIVFATAELNRLEQQLRELCISIPKSIHLFCDNMSATFITANPVIHDKSKHINIYFHYVKEQVTNGDVLV